MHQKLEEQLAKWYRTPPLFEIEYILKDIGLEYTRVNLPEHNKVYASDGTVFTEKVHEGKVRVFVQSLKPAPRPSNIDELIDRARNGDQEAFESFRD